MCVCVYTHHFIREWNDGKKTSKEVAYVVYGFVYVKCTTIREWAKKSLAVDAQDSLAYVMYEWMSIVKL